MGIDKQRKKIDKVRASRDGHEFHEAWAARKATQLLWPDTDLIAIAVEGLSPTDQAGATASTIEIADLTFYYGLVPNFKDSARTTIAQLKYSIADQDNDFRASHTKKTVEKFSAIYRSFKRKYGAEAVEAKLDFQLVTNQPINGSLIQAIDATARGASPTGDVKEQAKQFKAASGLSGKSLENFARKLKIIGRTANLRQTKNEIASLLVDWSATSDLIATARLGKLRELIRDKAGYAGTDRNLIRRTDLLAALQIGDPKDLLPCEAALVDVGPVLEREQLYEAIVRISNNSTPLLIHATGGVGKTVFMHSLASKLSTDYEVVFFDCFGGGAYRSPEDARHLPKKGLIHIANTLAFRGLCDPLLPDSPDVHTLLRAYRRRLTQCLNTISRMMPGRKLAIFIDAIDNAIFAAGQTSEDCFPIKLLESLDTEPINGVKLVVSCRTERKPHTYSLFDEFELRPFSKGETGAFLRARLKNVTDVEVNVAQARSGGNPRVLDYLVNAGRGLLDPSEIDKDIELDDLIQQRITDALSLATKRGYEERDLSAFLAGLAVLPPPVPVDEYAAAHGMECAVIESFASDLSPLLERTNHGLMFRDEPTETLIHKRYATSPDTLERVASHLLARQDSSVYAASALPRLLYKLGHGERLFELAFDDRIPASITSTVGRRHIQYARLRAATLHAALQFDYNRLVHLLVELSTIAEVDQRGVDYLLNHPALVVAAKDIDALRRLFEIKTAWPGTRHARLAIVNVLSGDTAEATRHANSNEEWIQHYRRSQQNDFNREPIPGKTDIAASSFFLISEGRTEAAAGYLKGWQDWYAFEVTQLVLGYAHLAYLLGTWPTNRVDQFIVALSSIGPITAALSFHELANAKRRRLCVNLAALCKKRVKLDLPQNFSLRKSYRLEDGLRKSAAIALSLGLVDEAQSISLRVPHDRPGIWAYRDEFNHTDVFGYIFQVALLSAARQTAIHEKDLLPKDLGSVCVHIPNTISGKTFREKAKERLSKLPRKPSYNYEKTKDVPANAISDEEQQATERFLDNRLEPLLAITVAFSAALAASVRTIDKRFVQLVEAWEQARKKSDHYHEQDIDKFFQFLGFDVVLFILWSRSELKPQSILRMLDAVHAHKSNASDLIRIIVILAQRNPLHSIAGEQAVQARAMIEKEDEVTYRASLYGALGRAMLPASLEEAAVYFRDGLGQMDAIGSGDYMFTNQLLLFASEMKGGELEERDFHTLSNICELNLGEEPYKFPWGAYGRGMAKAAGLRGLAKLSRWDDRNRIALDSTLLPYLTGLLEAGKIDPKAALCINRLANPVEYYYAGSMEFGKALRAQAGPDAETVTELITQFEDDNPTIASDETVETLYSLSDETLGAAHDLTKHLKVARDRYETARQGRNTSNGSRSHFDPKMRREAANRDNANRDALAHIVKATDPTDEASLVRALDECAAFGSFSDIKGYLFPALRAKVPFKSRGQYVRNIANLEHLYFYWKLAELKEAKEEWGWSSAALKDVYKSFAKPLIRAHVHNLVDDGRLSGSSIKEISELTGVNMADLVVELIEVYTRSDISVDGSVWLAFASFICPEAEEGQGQFALQRLLTSDSARLANNVTDGPWEVACYPVNDFSEIAAGLIWRVLGSPHAAARWRAAHCIRRFAKFGRWDIVDKVVASFSTKSAAPFQAAELVFYNLHARLWCLIALARVALDYPDQVARYKGLFLTVTMEKGAPHVLMQHFAANALLTCVNRGELTLEAGTLQTLRNAVKSPHPRLRKKVHNDGGFYQGRPKSVPEPLYRFHLEYDFNKYDVNSLGRVFGKGCWEVDELISSVVKKFDPSASHMLDDGGRESNERRSRGLNTDFHGYGQQLGWHALFIAAGKLLAGHPVIDDRWYDDPWEKWLEDSVLSRKDGLWLSDGTDRTPDDVSVRLLESKKKGLAITGNPQKIIGLAGLDIVKGVRNELIIHGEWYSSDGVEIGITSALVPPQKADKIARKLIREKPILVWVPTSHDADDDDEFLRNDKMKYSPWIVCPSGESRLDKHDPYGVSVANVRPHLAQDYLEFCKLSQQDAFGCCWKSNSGTIALRAQAWGRDETDRDDGLHPGLRLLCTSTILKKVLMRYDKHLLLLFNLQRYESENYRSSGRFSHSIGVALIDKSLNVKYFKGRVNYSDKSDW